jgi:murein tripeptide amidase MpaA
MTQPALPEPRFDLFLRHDALTRLLFDYADAKPELLSVVSIGKSHEGRDIWLAVLTNTGTGAHTDKPAFWVDGNIHAAELTGSTACLYWLHRLLRDYGRDARVTQLLDTRTIYLCPRLNPDGAELALGDRPRHIRSSTRPYPYDEPHVEGLTVEDVDGDGRVLTMRIRDPHGGWKPHAQEPRLMVPREPGEFGGDYYRLMPEGTLAHFDGIEVNVNRDIEGLDLNRNFPARWRQEFQQTGAGPFPTSEPEVRAMVDFVTAHPNIGAAVSFHTHSGVILRPPSAHADEEMIPEDLWTYQRFGEIGEKLTGYPAVGIWKDFRYHPKDIISGTQDWFYEHLGALFFTVELWSPNREAGISGYKWTEWYRDHPVEDDLKLLKWSDDKCDGLAHVDWRPFRHPQLGLVEIGGWDRMNFWRNPPPALREREVERFPAWLETIALSLPRLELLRAEVRALGNDTWRVRLAVANAGWLPAYVTRQALLRKVVRGVVFEIHLPPQAQLVSGQLREVGPQLEGHAPKTSMQSFLPDHSVTGDRAVGEWIVKAPKGTPIALSARAERAGTVRTEVLLD